MAEMFLDSLFLLLLLFYFASLSRNLKRHPRPLVVILARSQGRYTRGSLLLKHAPETRTRVGTLTSTHQGHHEGAER